MALLRASTSKEKRFMGQSLLQKAGNFFEKKMYEKSLHLYLATYGLFVCVEVEEVKNNNGTQLNSLNDDGLLYNGLSFVKDCVSCRLRITKKEEDSNLLKKIKDSLVFFSLLGMGKCFNNLFGFKEAKDCLEEAEIMEPKNSCLLFLQSQNLSFCSSLKLDNLSKAKTLLRSSKLLLDAESLFKNRETVLRQFQLNNFGNSLTRHHKYILKKKKALENKIKQMTNELTGRSLLLFKSGELVESLLKELNGKIKSINFIVGFVQASFFQNLRYYRQNRNNKDYNRIRKEYYQFKLFKDELEFIKRTKANGKVTDTDLKDQLNTILNNKKMKEKFLKCFEVEKLRQIIKMNQKFKEENNFAEKQNFDDKKLLVLKDLRRQYNARKRKEEEEGFNITLADCSFLVTFVILIAKLTDLVIDI